MFGKYENINYDSDSGSGMHMVCNSIISLHLGRGVVSSVRMVSLVHLGPNVSSSAHDRGCVVNGSGATAAI